MIVKAEMNSEAELPVAKHYVHWNRVAQGGSTRQYQYQCLIGEDILCTRWLPEPAFRAHFLQVHNMIPGNASKGRPRKVRVLVGRRINEGSDEREASSSLAEPTEEAEDHRHGQHFIPPSSAAQNEEGVHEDDSEEDIDPSHEDVEDRQQHLANKSIVKNEEEEAVGAMKEVGNSSRRTVSTKGASSPPHHRTETLLSNDLESDTVILEDIVKNLKRTINETPVSSHKLQVLHMLVEEGKKWLANADLELRRLEKEKLRKQAETISMLRCSQAAKFKVSNLQRHHQWRM
ncbi:hypothetical protein R1flu_013336 [Riccia fluitans]|uniref:Uncharacterized protein n=1 Tax=Riccia fluitans TaxID=41844 RepID=A0ABD1YDA9_9MARC